MQIENLITEHIDTWTSAVKKKNATGRGSSKKIELYGIKKLRELILELAVRGKLVPQDANDEPASVLLERIEKETAQLVKEKKIKKPKLFADISREEDLLKLPRGWVRARFGKCFALCSGNSFKKDEELTSGEYVYCKVGDMNLEGNNDCITTSSKFINPNERQLNSLIMQGSIIFPKRGGAIATNKKRFVRKSIFADSNVMAVRPFNGISLEYSMLWLSSIDLALLNTGTSVPQINNKDIDPLVFSFPPINEQHRIVAKVDELMLLCDQLEQQTESSIDAHKTLVEVLLNTLTDAKDANELQTNWARVSEFFDPLFTTEHSIDQLKQTILQLAVMGKLVPQDPNDEPASKLLARIADEKAQLIADKKIKKQKALPPITDEEKPFELPNGWEFTRLGDIYDVSSSKRIHVKDYVKSGIPFFRSKEIGELGRGGDISTELFIAQEQYDNLKTMLGFPRPNDLMLASIGGSIGNNWISDEREFYYKDGNITKIGHHKFANTRYLKMFVDSKVFWKQVTGGVSGSAYNALTIIKIQSMTFPLPPLLEQTKIVIKVEELMTICDQLKSQLNQAQQTLLNLTDALVAQAV